MNSSQSDKDMTMLWLSGVIVLVLLLAFSYSTYSTQSSCSCSQQSVQTVQSELIEREERDFKSLTETLFTAPVPIAPPMPFVVQTSELVVPSVGGVVIQGGTNNYVRVAGTATTDATRNTVGTTNNQIQIYNAGILTAAFDVDGLYVNALNVTGTTVLRSGVVIQSSSGNDVLNIQANFNGAATAGNGTYIMPIRNYNGNPSNTTLYGSIYITPTNDVQFRSGSSFYGGGIAGNTLLNDNVFFQTDPPTCFNGDGSKTIYSNSINLRAGNLINNSNVPSYGSSIYIQGGLSVNGAINHSSIIHKSGTHYFQDVIGSATWAYINPTGLYSYGSLASAGIMTCGNNIAIYNRNGANSISQMWLYNDGAITGAGMFLNGSTRDVDGGRNVLTIRNDLGSGIRIDSALRVTQAITSSAEWPQMTFTGNASINDVGMILNCTAPGGRNYSVASGGTGSGAGANFYIFDNTSGVPRLTINSSGRVTIPGSLSVEHITDTSGSTRLSINSTGRVTIPGALSVGLSTNTNTESGTLICDKIFFKNEHRITSDSDYFRIFNSKTWYTMWLYNGGWASDSDVRLKKNITSISSSLENILQLRPVTFHFKTQLDSDQLHHGFIAQEVQNYFPHSVHEINNKENDSTTLGLSETSLIPHLVKAIQEQQLQIKVLSDRLSQLEK
jgi:hypothetical protein